MTDEGRRVLSAEELARAEEELRAAECLLAGSLPRVALTRAYFAVFHALRGLLYSEGLEPRSHRGVQHLFNIHFIRTGRFEPAAARLAARLQKYREEADYSEGFVVDAQGAREEIDAAAELTSRVRQRLTASGG